MPLNRYKARLPNKWLSSSMWMVHSPASARIWFRELCSHLQPSGHPTWRPTSQQEMVVLGAKQNHPPPWPGSNHPKKNTTAFTRWVDSWKCLIRHWAIKIKEVWLRMFKPSFCWNWHGSVYWNCSLWPMFIASLQELRGWWNFAISKFSKFSYEILFGMLPLPFKIGSNYK